MRESNSFKQSDQEEYLEVPPWLTIMYNVAVYFDACITHPNTKKNELDRFCIDCVRAFCYHCLPAHDRHKHVKIRRYIYCEVINRKDLCGHFNCSGIQAYRTNKTKVLFLKQRPPQLQNQNQQGQQHNSKDNSCMICQRTLQDPSPLYCSIQCKVTAIRRGEHNEQIVNNQENLSKENDRDRGLSGNTTPKKEDLRQSSSSKRKNVRGSVARKKVRKGAPLRAPMF